MSEALGKIKRGLLGLITAEKPDSRGMDILYLVSLAAYLLHYQAKLLAWTEGNKIIGDVGAMVLLDGAFVVMMAYLVWGVLRRTIHLPCVLAFAVGAALLLRFWPGMQYEVRCWIINIFLILAARGRRYDLILRVYLGVFAACVLLGLVGLAAGFTYEHYKWQLYGKGYALGYSNANNLSRILLWSAGLLWLLRWRDRDLAAVLCFGAVAVAAAFLTLCRTVAVMAVLIPALLILTHHWKPWNAWGRRSLRAAGICVTAAPFLMLLLSLALSFAVIPLIPYFRSSAVWNLLVRFVQNNIALQEYGVHLTGRNIDFLGNVSRTFNGEEMRLLILDNAYVPWLIRNGLIRTVLLLGLLSASVGKCVRRRNRPLLILFLSILLYGLMEPAAVQVQYNFAFLYLLAADETDREEVSP